MRLRSIVIIFRPLCRIRVSEWNYTACRGSISAGERHFKSCGCEHRTGAVYGSLFNTLHFAGPGRGFPQRVLRILKILKAGGARVAIVFHDVEPYPGTRLIDSVRRFDQVFTMRCALALADRRSLRFRRSDFPGWPLLRQIRFSSRLGPICRFRISPLASFPRHQVPTIGVFSITDGEGGSS